MPYKNKEIRKAYAKNWWQANKYKVKKYKSDAYEKHKGEIKAVRALYYREHRDVKMAQSLVRQALVNGVLKRMPCGICGNLIVDAHHNDYQRALEVEFLCRKHHMEKHGALSHSLS